MYCVQVRLFKEYRCKHLDVYIYKSPQMSCLVVVKCYCPKLIEIVRKLSVFLAKMCFKVYKRVLFFLAPNSFWALHYCIVEKENIKDILFY